MALVVYSEARVADSLKLDSRQFNFFGKEISIKQGYEEGGKGGTDIGFGASVYNGSFVLSDYVRNHTYIVRDKNTIELGGGPGLLSIVSMMANARSVLCTDGDEISVKLAQENIELNFGDKMHSQCGTQRLLWGDGRDIDAALKLLNKTPCTGKDSKQVVNAPTDSYPGVTVKYDTILASDVVAVPYEKAYNDLIRTFDALLADHGTIWLCYQRRHASEQRFFELFNSSFTVTEIPQVELHKDFQDTVTPLKLFCAVRL